MGREGVEAGHAYIQLCAVVCYARVSCLESRVFHFQSGFSSLVACAQSIPKSHQSQRDREREREGEREGGRGCASCWLIAWRLCHLLQHNSSPQRAAAFHILCASTSASHQAHCVPNGLRVSRPTSHSCTRSPPPVNCPPVSSSLVATAQLAQSTLWRCCFVHIRLASFCLAATTLLLSLLSTLSSKFDYKHCCHGQNK